MKQQASGSETIQEIELVDGRGNPGQSWIVKFNNIDSDEEVCLFICLEYDCTFMHKGTRMVMLNLWPFFCLGTKTCWISYIGER